MAPDETTIAALATPPGMGALAVLRVSGPKSLPLLQEMSGVPAWQPWEARHVTLRHQSGEVLDDVVATFWQAPKSYTGEDVVEISCHGNPMIVQRILTYLFSASVVPAGPGEFTQRAFLNGKMDLTSAEAVQDLIAASTEAALRGARSMREGKLGRELDQARDILIEVLAHLEAYIDFPDEDISPDVTDGFQQKIETVTNLLEHLLKTAPTGRVLREGVATAIVGAPNVGKSSLLNAMLRESRAIVSSTPGTTRDTIEAECLFGGVLLRLIDTAGQRDASDPIEHEGIERAKAATAQAKLILHVVDGHEPACRDGIVASALAADQLYLKLANKMDLGLHADHADAIAVSALKKEGLQALDARIRQAFLEHPDVDQTTWLTINARQEAAVQRAAEACRHARQQIEQQTPPELISIDLREALEAVGEVVGASTNEDILDRLFSSFCIGK